MPLIKPRTRGKQLVRLWTRLDRETNETLHAYAHFIGETAEYVFNQLIDTVLAKDKEFLQWRATHPGSFVPDDVTARGSGPKASPASAPSRTERATSGPLIPEATRAGGPKEQ